VLRADAARFGPAEVRVRYGVDPEQVPDFIALRGDPSDKLPGAPGVGAVGAATLIRRYGTLEQALAAGRFPALAKELRLYRSIATMFRKRRCRRCATSIPLGRMPPRLRKSGSSINLRSGLTLHSQP
jgi:5'-3' exonuclease